MSIPTELDFSDGTKAIVSPEDADLIASNHWWKTQGYASGRIDGKFVYLHRIVLQRAIGRELSKNEFTDHININPLDNRRENLRVANGSESLRNRNKQAGMTSKFIGVSWFSGAAKRIKRWRATYRLNGKSVTVGYYSTEEDAAKARDEAVKKCYGEFARLNNV